MQEYLETRQVCMRAEQRAGDAVNACYGLIIALIFVALVVIAKIKGKL